MLMADDLKLVYDGAAIAELLRSPTGPMGLFLIERGEMVKQAAKLNIRNMTQAHTGCLEDSPVKRFAADGAMLTVTIQSDTSPCSPTHESYSLMVHEGTRPHVIAARNASTLAFPWRGQMAFFQSVNHPGTTPRPFLRNALEQIAAIA